jgi:hypothetical protein
MISSKSERAFIRDLNNLALHIIFDGWWAATNAGWKQPIASNNSRPASLQ